MSSLFQALTKAKGTGSAKNGTQHFIMQRTTALLLIPIVIYFLCAIVQLVHADDYGDVVEWFHSPFNSGISTLFIIIGFYHGILGLQVVIEDYVHCEKLKWASLIIIKFICLLFAAAAIISIIRLAVFSSLFGL